MKKLQIILLLFIGFYKVDAQDAKVLLELVTKKYENASSYYIKFEFSYSKDKKSENKSGEVFSLKNKFNLNVDHINQIFDGKKLITIDKEDKEITVSNSSKTDDFLTPTKILTTYKNNFNYSLDKLQSQNSVSIQYIKLIPKDKNSNYKYCMLGINKKNNEIYQYQEFSKDNSITSITVKEYIENLVIHKSYFNFDPSKYSSKGYVITQLD